ncbi:hypothetical protein [Marinobacter sp. SS5-14b]|uniref:hypothetical protein n=1 Tax=Marinobacter sp. SS5-14b TaxID=3050456 RepID=UPI0026E06967|nr:hypothetical protein [Marinobacter sp. SS5-14b]
MSWVLDAGFAGMRFYDLPNFMLCVLFVLICGQRLKVPAIFQFVLLLHCLLPFFLNGVLFSFSFMPDAFKYWHAFNEIRGGDLSLVAAWQKGNVEQAAALFALIPFPLAVTPLSLGFFNTFLYAALFFWLYSKRVFTPASVWFFLLYPSMALYTGMGLRDTFIFIFMVMAIQWAREGRWWLALLPLYLLFMIKFQNFFILGPVLLLYVMFGIRKTGVSAAKAVVVSVIGLVTLVAVSPVALPLINKFRGAMYVEDGGDVSDVEFLETPAEFVLEGLVSGFYFLAKPLPWEATNILQLIQAGENLVILMVLFLLVRVSWKKAPEKLIFWLLFMALALTVYGLVVFNYGTAARYRYPFIAIFVLFVCADCSVRKVIPFTFRKRTAGDCPVNLQHHD